MNLRLLKKTDLNTSVKNSSFSMGLEETACGKMCVLTVGSFHVFTELVTSICNLHVNVQIFRKIFILMFRIQTCGSSLGDIFWGGKEMVYILYSKKINAPMSILQKEIYWLNNTWKSGFLRKHAL